MSGRDRPGRDHLPAPRKYGNNSYFAGKRQQQEKDVQMIRKKSRVPLFVKGLKGIVSLKRTSRTFLGA